MARSAPVETPAVTERRKLKQTKRRAFRYRYWATMIEQGRGQAVALALRALADRLDPPGK